MGGGRAVQRCWLFSVACEEGGRSSLILLHATAGAAASRLVPCCFFLPPACRRLCGRSSAGYLSWKGSWQRHRLQLMRQHARRAMQRLAMPPRQRRQPRRCSRRSSSSGRCGSSARSTPGGGQKWMHSWRRQSTSAASGSIVPRCVVWAPVGADSLMLCRQPCMLSACVPADGVAGCKLLCLRLDWGITTRPSWPRYACLCAGC